MITQPPDPALAGLIRGNVRLFRLLYAFNFRPADYLHASRRGQFCDVRIGEKVWRETRARNALSTLILRRLGLEERSCFDTGRWEWRIALLGQASLARLASHIGAAMLGSQIRRSMARSEVLAWREKLSEEAYRFAMTSASLLRVPPAGDGADAGHAPEAMGFGWMRASLADSPPELRERMLLKFPAQPAQVAAASAEARRFVETVLIALEPQWYSLFGKI